MKYFSKKKLTEIINFGKMPMANNFVKSKKEKIKKEKKKNFNT